jgi:hypothetical protein
MNIEIINILIAFFNLVFFIILTLLIHNYNKSKDKLDFIRQTPLISIEQYEDHNYYFKNIGSGPALNIKILSIIDFENNKWGKNEIGFSLFSNSKEIELNTFDKKAYLIIYNDIHKNEYYSFMIDSMLEFGRIKDVKKKTLIKKILDFDRPNEEFRNIHIPSV